MSRTKLLQHDCQRCGRYTAANTSMLADFDRMGCALDTNMYAEVRAPYRFLAKREPPCAHGGSVELFKLLDLQSSSREGCRRQLISFYLGGQTPPLHQRPAPTP